MPKKKFYYHQQKKHKGKKGKPSPKAVAEKVNQPIGNNMGQVSQSQEDLTNSITNILQQQALAADIRANTPKYQALFSKFGVQFTDDIAKKLIGNTPDSAAVQQQVFEMQQLEPFYDVQKFYQPNAPLSVDTARQYAQQYGTGAEAASRLKNHFEAVNYFNAHGLEDIELAKHYMNVGYTPEQVMSAYEGGSQAESFNELLNKAKKQQQASFTPEQEEPGFEFENGLPKLKGANSVFV